MGVEAFICTHWADGSAGTEAIAARVRELADGSGGDNFAPLYEEELPVEQKIRTIATELYRAGDVVLSDAARAEIRRLTKLGYGNLPVCMAKTQYSFSSDPALRGAPEGHTLEVREVRLSAGAGFIVVVCGSIMTMPGLPKVPAANAMYVNAQGQIENLS
jgi:formate--tetrahydrofolate ligase